MAAMFLFPHQLSIFFLLRLAPTLCSGAALAHFASLCLCLVLGVLAVDLGENLLYARIRVRIDEVAEQVGQTEQVSETSNCVVLL